MVIKFIIINLPIFKIFTILLNNEKKILVKMYFYPILFIFFFQNSFNYIFVWMFECLNILFIWIGYFNKLITHYFIFAGNLKSFCEDFCKDFCKDCLVIHITLLQSWINTPEKFLFPEYMYIYNIKFQFETVFINIQYHYVYFCVIIINSPSECVER